MPVAIFNDTPPKHFLIVPHALWGHLRPSIGLSTNLIKLSPNNLVTLLIPSILSKQSEIELKRYTYDATRLHIVHIDVGEASSLNTEAKGAFMTMKRVEARIQPTMASVTQAYAKLLKCQPLTDHLTGGEIPSFDVPPSVAIIDITIAAQAIEVLPQMNKLSGLKDRVRLLCLAPLSAQWAMYSEVQDAAGGCRAILGASEENRGKAYAAWIGENEDMIEVPGLPPTHVFEMSPNQPDGYVPLMAPVLETLHKWNGLFNIWPKFLGEDFQAYNDERGIACMQVGPQLPVSVLEGQEELFGEDEDSRAIKSFLDRQVIRKGTHSVVYISFGSLFFSPSLIQLQTLLENLKDLDIPYVLANGGASPEIKEMCERQAEYNENARILGWAPQSAILGHEAIMAFLTHGGSTSVIEAITSHVPLTYDQVQTASAFSWDKSPFRSGVELLQVRNGYNIGRKTASGILVEGTVESMREEFETVLRGMRGNLVIWEWI